MTASLEEVLADPAAYEDKCLRALLQPGESLDRPIDCLQLVVQRAEETPSVEFASFDLMRVRGGEGLAVGTGADSLSIPGELAAS